MSDNFNENSIYDLLLDKTNEMMRDVTLLQLRDALKQWRQNKTSPKERIPKEFLKSAGILARKYDISQIAKVLGLNYITVREFATGIKRTLKNNKQSYSTNYSDNEPPKDITLNLLELENAYLREVRVALERENMALNKIIEELREDIHK